MWVKKGNVKKSWAKRRSPRAPRLKGKEKDELRERKIPGWKRGGKTGGTTQGGGNARWSGRNNMGPRGVTDGTVEKRRYYGGKKIRKKKRRGEILKLKWG